MGPIRHGGYGPPRESFVGIKWAEEMMMMVAVVVMVEDGGENGKNYDENNDWEKVWGGLLVGFTGMVMVI